MIKFFVCLLLITIDIFYFEKRNKTTLIFGLLGLVVFFLYFLKVKVSDIIIYLIDLYVVILFLLNCYYLRKQKQKGYDTLTALIQLLLMIIMGIIIKFV